MPEYERIPGWGFWPKRQNTYMTSYAGGSAFSGRQATSPTVPTNPFNPTCPWGLINQMIQQIAQYVSQLQQSQGAIGPNTAQGFGLTNYATSPFGAGRGGPYGFAAGMGPAMRVMKK